MKLCIASTEFLFLSNRICKFREKLLFIKLPTSMILFVWLSSFTWVALASSYSLYCMYHRCLFTSRWWAKCCILIVLHLFMNISYGTYCMLHFTETPLFNILLLKVRIFRGFQSDSIISPWWYIYNHQSSILLKCAWNFVPPPVLQGCIATVPFLKGKKRKQALYFANYSRTG